MLNVRNLRCGYNGFEVIKNISFKVDEGEKVCIIGPNGCGKTTLLKSIASLVKSQGEILLDEKNINKMKRYEIASKVGILRQTETIYFAYTVFETVMLGRYLHMKRRIFGEYDVHDEETVLNCLESVGLIKEKNRKIDTLSGGQIQRVFLAKIFAQDPKLFLLDEPTNHLDLRFQIELMDYLNKWIKKSNRTIIGVLHDINLARQFADRFILLSEGEIAYDGDFKTLTKCNLLKEVYQMDIKQFMLNSLKVWEN